MLSVENQLTETADYIAMPHVAAVQTSDIQDPPQSHSMAYNGLFLRLMLLVTIFSIVILGSQLHWRDDPIHENDPPDSVFKVLNCLFKQEGWCITLVVWLFLLAAKYTRQVSLQENASWRRHAVVDAVLLGLFWGYWFYATNLVFPMVADNIGECAGSSVPSSQQLSREDCENTFKGQWTPFDISGHVFLAAMGIFILAEEIIRAISSPAAHFTFPIHLVDRKVQFARIGWAVAVSCALVVILAWTVLLVRTSLWFHTIEEKILGAIIGTGFWLLELTVRLACR